MSPVPVLARAVVVDEQDLYRLRNAGADAVVVRVEWVPDAAKLSALRKAARSMMMEILVEVEDEPALRVVLASDAAIVGVAGPEVALLEKIPANRVPVRVGGARGVRAPRAAPRADRRGRGGRSVRRGGRRHGNRRRIRGAEAVASRARFRGRWSPSLRARRGLRR